MSNLLNKGHNKEIDLFQKQFKICIFAIQRLGKQAKTSKMRIDINNLINKAKSLYNSYGKVSDIYSQVSIIAAMLPKLTSFSSSNKNDTNKLESASKPTLPKKEKTYAQWYRSNTDEIGKAGLYGFDLLLNPEVNKGLSFTEEERVKYKLKGLLPAGIHNQAHQLKLIVDKVREFKDPLNKYMYLRNLQDHNKHLFYLTLQTYPDEMMPIVYTPTVGLACQQYSKIFKRPRGMFITINDAGNLENLFDNWHKKVVKAIVVTDGERTLGLGDLGANAMGISVGKMALYSAIGGIHPYLTLPVCIDVGTNNESLLKDPYYIGLHKKRVQGKAYDALIDEFMECVVKRFGDDCLVQFEDFGNKNAFRLLDKYRHDYCTFNDDIQGTASVSVAGILASTRVTRLKTSENIFLFQGAGSAATGIADLLVLQMKEEGLSVQEARDRIYMCDIDGLVTTERTDTDGKMRYAKNLSPNNLEGVVKLVKPSCIIGVSTAAGTFTPAILKMMAMHHQHPIVFALSNPTSKAECTAEEAYKHTDGKCLFASGSPFAPVEYRGKVHEPGQGNNAYIFPAVALSVISCGVKTIPEETFLKAAQALSEELSEEELNCGRLYPRMKHIREVTLNMATKISTYFFKEGLAHLTPEPYDKSSFIRNEQYNPIYDDSFKNK